MSSEVFCSLSDSVILRFHHILAGALLAAVFGQERDAISTGLIIAGQGRAAARAGSRARRWGRLRVRRPVSVPLPPARRWRCRSSRGAPAEPVCLAGGGKVLCLLWSLARRALGTDRATVPDAAGFAQAVHHPVGWAHLGSGQSVGRGGSTCPGAVAGSPGASWAGTRPRVGQETSLHAVVMLLGDSGVGKTCFLLQFKDGAFLSRTFIATVGIDFRNKVVAVDGVKVKLQIWDTAGQERFRSITHAYYRDAQALLLLYDITSKMSFDNIRAWLTEIHEYAQKDVVIMLLGNKADVSSERAVRTEDGASLAREYGVPFMETSAKTGMNVELAFLAIAKELKQRAAQQPDEPRFEIRDYIESQKKKSGCCAFA